jgi:hypothetical protein
VQEAGAGGRSGRQVQEVRNTLDTRELTDRLDKALVPRRARRTSPLSKRYAGGAHESAFLERCARTAADILPVLPTAPAACSCRCCRLLLITRGIR